MSDFSVELPRVLTSVQKYLDQTRDEESEVDVNPIRFECADASPDMVAVDGSHSFIFDFSGIKLVAIRVCALTYEFIKEFDEKIGYKLRCDLVVEHPILVSSHESFVREQSEVYQKLHKSARKSQLKTHTYIANELRRYEECRLMNRVAGEVSGKILALDGALTTPPFLDEFAHLMEDTIRLCEKNENILVGISKDSATHMLGHISTDEDLLRKLVKTPALYYLRAEGEDAHPQPHYGDIYFAKLFPHAPKWFRVDVGTFKDDPDHVFSAISQYARSEICPGYPYPLLEAHKYVVTVRHLREMYENVVLKLAPKYGISMEDVISGRTNIDGLKASAFHEFLDRISKVKS
ncbi:MAG: DNA double-strand break repair nuclease NurA [Methanocellales archaeon]|nr:DNA double-strand break repair nuclease NurA [Methanocellales archaeon]